jgi:hypothetical protein
VRMGEDGSGSHCCEVDTCFMGGLLLTLLFMACDLEGEHRVSHIGN